MSFMRPKRDEAEIENDDIQLGSDAAGQAGDLQGLTSEEVISLLEEGQSFDAGVVAGIEDAALMDEEEIRTREVPEDDVPLEYLDDERDNRLG